MNHAFNKLYTCVIFHHITVEKLIKTVLASGLNHRDLIYDLYSLNHGLNRPKLNAFMPLAGVNSVSPG